MTRVREMIEEMACAPAWDREGLTISAGPRCFFNQFAALVGC